MSYNTPQTQFLPKYTISLFVMLFLSFSVKCAEGAKCLERKELYAMCFITN